MRCPAHLGRTVSRLVLVCGALCSAGAALVSTARADTAMFTSAGEQPPFTVPAGVSSLHVVAIGGRGGSGATGAGLGGFGATASADVAVTPGQVLYIEVAGNSGDGFGTTAGKAGVNGGGASGAGAGSGGAGAGGGGGGASDIRGLPMSAGASSSLASRLIVAAGGGGGSGGGGNGGAAGADGSPTGGGTGTLTIGGQGASPNGGMGTLGVGGTGGNGSGSGATATGGGGGGGGGSYGGGGGASFSSGSSGGGGGSTAFASGVTGGSSVTDTTGTPSVTLTYAGPPAISITTPASGATYTQGQVVNASYACTSSAGSTLSSCSGPVANGAAIDTTTPGQHSFTVTGSDQDGGHATATSSYTVNPPSSGPAKGTSTAGIASAHTNAAGTTVTLTLACTGVAGAVCTDSVVLTVIEHLQGKRLLAVSAAKSKRRRVTKRVVTVGSAALTLSSGQPSVVRLSLNAIGERLLARFRHLTVNLRVTQTAVNAKSLVVSRQQLTLRAPAGRHKRHR
jgi:hypothetical protein